MKRLGRSSRKRIVGGGDRRGIKYSDTEESNKFTALAESDGDEGRRHNGASTQGCLCRYLQKGTAICTGRKRKWGISDDVHEARRDTEYGNVRGKEKRKRVRALQRVYKGKKKTKDG